MDWKEWNGKKIFVKLKGGAVYSGFVIDVDNSFITIRDKFGDKVSFNVSEIIKIKEENGAHHDRNKL